MKNLLCPYMKNNTCYHSHCIYKPNYECNKSGMNKLSKKNKTRVKTVKKRNKRTLLNIFEDSLRKEDK